MSQDFLQKLITSIDANIGNPDFGVKELSDHMGMSQSTNQPINQSTNLPFI